MWNWWKVEGSASDVMFLDFLVIYTVLDYIHSIGIGSCSWLGDWMLTADLGWGLKGGKSPSPLGEFLNFLASLQWEQWEPWGCGSMLPAPTTFLTKGVLAPPHPTPIFYAIIHRPCTNYTKLSLSRAMWNWKGNKCLFNLPSFESSMAWSEVMLKHLL